MWKLFECACSYLCFLAFINLCLFGNKCFAAKCRSLCFCCLTTFRCFDPQPLEIRASSFSERTKIQEQSGFCQNLDASILNTLKQDFAPYLPVCFHGRQISLRLSKTRNFPIAQNYVAARSPLFQHKARTSQVRLHGPWINACVHIHWTHETLNVVCHPANHVALDIGHICTVFKTFGLFVCRCCALSRGS